MRPFITDDPVFDKSRRELSTKGVRRIIDFYVKRCGLGAKQEKFSLPLYDSEFLSTYYTPILAVMCKHYGTLKGKRVLEIGYRVPMFLDYLKSIGVSTVGIDIAPYAEGKDLYRMDVERMPRVFKERYAHKFDIIFERLTLSRLLDEMHVFEDGTPRFKNKKRILSNIKGLLKPNGLLILQDDRGSIFTLSQLKEAGFEKAMRGAPIILKNRKGKYLGWNTIEAYKRI